MDFGDTHLLMAALAHLHEGESVAFNRGQIQIERDRAMYVVTKRPIRERKYFSHVLDVMRHVRSWLR